MRLIAQLLQGISRVLQKFLNNFLWSAILASFVLPSVGIFLVSFNLDLNEVLLPEKLSILPLLSKAGSLL